MLQDWLLSYDPRELFGEDGEPIEGEEVPEGEEGEAAPAEGEEAPSSEEAEDSE